ncbi:hypothetical protein STRIP9103_03889 [Streptomyces ipomoeae 91-03]|uniref:Uncharacterized protein n=1 Tax=Streptomyces ipomoeae 91-03 TaxID=698759 RepID=L1L766_9ACTN|nr:hypothetical protein STRIP9103_03889 [Streptomyces ipomoeae 91-03]
MAPGSAGLSSPAARRSSRPCFAPLTPPGIRGTARHGAHFHR